MAQLGQRMNTEKRDGEGTRDVRGKTSKEKKAIQVTL